jgi:hypothetical protein
MHSDPLSLLLSKAENRALLAALLRGGVELVVIGGTALAQHGLRDIVQVDDLDLLVNPTVENADRIASVLQTLGTPLTGSSSVLARRAIQVPLKTAQYWAELLTPVQDLSFEEIYRTAAVVQVAEFAVRVAGIPHLRRMKELAVKELRASLEKHEADLRRLTDA